jgi:class 3 adenylate cyclase/ATP/maltotriose-dependent transcriptional regulator MalT
MERKLASVLFVDLVASTELVSGADPEVVRRRVTTFFDAVAQCIENHGGTVEKFAGDAVMAAFGIPIAHEDDAERAVRAAMAIVGRVHELGLEARIGVESGEVVVDEADSTFATGQAVNVAARLQQAARPGEILIGESAHRLTAASVEAETAGPLELRGFRDPIRAFRPLATRDGPRAFGSLAAPFVGREAELELLENTYARTLRDRRPHVFTIYGEPGIGKSRLLREFVAGVEGATVLQGRALPYGEGVTYWPIAEMVKAAAGITDDDPLETAREKLLECCGDEAIVELLGMASGVLEAVEDERGQPEIAWAAREFANELAKVQPLIMVFEDIHWAEEPLLELIDHLAQWVRERALLIVCLARPELLEIRPTWGGGRVRATSIELEPLPRSDSERLADAFLADAQLPAEIRTRLLDTTEGNPLFVEESARMVLETGDGAFDRIPDTLQALIAARIDRLPASEKLLLQRASVIGRVFWVGSLKYLSPDFEEELEDALDDLLLRDLLTREQRSTIVGEEPYRFKHVLIREVAYGALSKSARAEYHRKFAEWLRERSDKELLEIRAYHLDKATHLLTELDGRAPQELVHEAAGALAAAGKRALSREAHRSARKLYLRAVELEPTLERRYNAARAAWRLGDLPALSTEMELLARDASDDGNRWIESRALVALADVALGREGDAIRATALLEQALQVVEPDDHAGRFQALDSRSRVAWWDGQLGQAESFEHDALEAARMSGHEDFEAKAALELATIHIARMDIERAEPLVERASELAEKSSSILVRAKVASTAGRLAVARCDDVEASRLLEQALELYTESGAADGIAHTAKELARVGWRLGDDVKAEKLLRESIRLLAPLEDRGVLCESQRLLAQLLLAKGRVDEAEKLALAAIETVGPADRLSNATTKVALAQVRAAQGMEGEAEQLFSEAHEALRQTEFRRIDLEVLPPYVEFLRARGRDEEAVELEARLAALTSASPA